MDASTILSIVISVVSIVISIIFAVVGFYFSNKSDTTLAKIQTKIETQDEKFMKLVTDAQTRYNDLSIFIIELMMKEVKVDKGEWSKESNEKLEEELSEALQQMQQNFNLAPSSIFSLYNKTGDR